MKGSYFQFFTKNRPQNHQNGAILHTSQAIGGARAPPPPLPGYATVYWCCSTVDHYRFLNKAQRIQILKVICLKFLSSPPAKFSGSVTGEQLSI